MPRVADWAAARGTMALDAPKSCRACRRFMPSTVSQPKASDPTV